MIYNPLKGQVLEELTTYYEKHFQASESLGR